MTARQLAIQVVERLQSAGFQSLWAGGCVRDNLLKIEPKDFDVATSANPDEVQQLFGVKKTLAIGKSFGVITVIGPKSAGNIEVATFRRDGGYSDGRHPDSVEFTDAKEDAIRRDFTINGMFFDPIAEEVIDYVGGQEDLQRKIIRAIGVANQRIEEDRLRMLRGVRFAATYEFAIEPATMRAIQMRAQDIEAVSPERIGSELRRMLGHRGKARALRLLVESGLWEQVLPGDRLGDFDWLTKIKLLENLDAGFSTTLAALLYGTGVNAENFQDPWRLKNEEVARANWLLANIDLLSAADTMAWSELQPRLMSGHASCAVQLLHGLIESGLCSNSALAKSSLELCRQKLQLADGVLDPPPLLRGDDLMELGIVPGPQFKLILSQTRALQLDGKLTSQEQARQWVVRDFK
ncbi:CCA tRNA nucleotidyltransferase [Mariniblastus fucicola]|uniref:tRNA nucleotidyltransferase/poly(A) polymerase n=1 Tax=Mariniblastus fucicola TaxID=980251 RepID=A0A5B9PP30_9BACT|nr:CCA tRNA nucleotidyltransferase [Mariniblastus fucicola]QEG24311.1 tRNA nucleotidyltransferase/poly(A) polymerase [Mariniblastus fucicola]